MAYKIEIETNRHACDYKQVFILPDSQGKKLKNSNRLLLNFLRENNAFFQSRAIKGQTVFYSCLNSSTLSATANGKSIGYITISEIENIEYLTKGN